MCDGFVALPDLNVQRPCDWRHIALPSMDDPFVQDQLTHIKRLREAIQDETAVFYNVFNPVSTLRSSTSDELVYDHLERREPALFEAITRVNEFKMEFMHRLISDAGVTGMFLPMQNNDLNGLREHYSGDGNVQADGIMSWREFYKVIQSANILIAEIGRTSVPKAEAEAFKAEAVFMRSLAYFFLVRNFGDVPYYTDAYHQEPLPRTNMVTVLQAIASDLNQILVDDPDAAYLPWAQVSLDKKAIRGSRGAVLALLMHVNMWLAGFDESHKTSYYEAVVNYGEQLVNQNGGTYTLLPLSQTNTIFRGGSSEGIFEIAQNPSYISGNEVFEFKAVFANEVMCSVYSPAKSTPNLCYTYDFLTKIYPPSETDDRVDAWFDENIYSTLDGAPKEILKFENPDIYNDGGALTANAGNQVVFRLADAILLYAEALADLGTNDGKACELLNRIRTRAGASTLSLSGDDLKDAIYWERVRELMGEGHYFYDLVRTGKVCDNNYCYHPITRSEFREGAWTWPISKTAQENNTLITLNNYWE